MHNAGVTTGRILGAKVMDNLIPEHYTAVCGNKGNVSDAENRAADGAGVL